MRTFLIAALLAGVATPALAARPHDGDGGRSERSERAEAKESAPKQERSAERPQPRIERRSENSGGSRVDKSANSNARSRTIDTGNTQEVEQVRRGDGGNLARGNRQHQQIVETGDVPHRNFEPKEVRPPRN